MRNYVDIKNESKLTSHSIIPYANFLSLVNGCAYATYDQMNLDNMHGDVSFLIRAIREDAAVTERAIARTQEAINRISNSREEEVLVLQNITIGE